MKIYSIILFAFLSFSFNVISQISFAEYNHKVRGYEDVKLVQKVYEIVIKNNKNELDVQLWAFNLFDSLEYSYQADSLATILFSKTLPKRYKCETRVYYVVGISKVESNEFDESIKILHQGLKTAKYFKDTTNIALINRNIGIDYLKLDQYVEAEKYLREALKLYTSINDLKGIANALISLGNSLKEQKKYDKGKESYLKSLEIAKKIKDERLIAGNYNNLGNIERRVENYQKALEFFFKALEMNRKSGNQLWESFNLNNIANTYNDLNQKQKSIEYHRLSLKLKMELGDTLNLVTSYLGLGDVLYDVGDFQNAYLNLKKSFELKDTLALSQQSTLMKELEAEYENEKKNLEIKQLMTKQKLDEQIHDGLEKESRQNKNLAVLSIFAGLILLGGVAILFRSNNAKKKSNTLLNLKNEQIENSNLALTSALDELSIKNKEIIDSINYATYIQKASLPNISEIVCESLKFNVFFAPKDIVSGDFYFHYRILNKTIFGVGDSTGHGVPGAMVSLVGLNAIEEVVRQENHSNSASMVESLNHQVVQSLQRGDQSLNDGMDLSFCIFDHASNTLQFTGANHTAYVLRKNSIVEDTRVNIKEQSNDFSMIEIKGTRRPIGKTIHPIPFEYETFQLMNNDRIVLFSDGYADQIGGPNSKKLKKGKMIDFLLNSASLDLNDQLDFMFKQFNSWKADNEQVDDVCLLMVDFKA